MHTEYFAWIQKKNVKASSATLKVDCIARSLLLSRPTTTRKSKSASPRYGFVHCVKNVLSSSYHGYKSVGSPCRADMQRRHYGRSSLDNGITERPFQELRSRKRRSAHDVVGVLNPQRDEILKSWWPRHKNGGQLSD